MQKRALTKEQALQKVRHYCAYQERSHFEVQQKLWSLGVKRSLHDEIIASLIQDNYLNEERFAVQFAGGKFRMKNWGKRKIQYALSEKHISAYCIRKAINALDEKEYHTTLQGLAQKKYTSLRHEPYPARKKKTIDYLVRKGYEPDTVTSVVNDLRQKGS